MLTVYIDFKSPAAYLALAPTLALSGRTGAALTWRPFRTTERALPNTTGTETASTESVAQSHRRVRAQSRRDTHIKYAAHQGIDLNFPDIPGETDLALGALATLSGDPLPFITAAFAAYWQGHANLDDPATVTALLAGQNADTSQTPQDLRRTQVAAQVDADAAGIVDAPAYLIKDQLFIGREHLPWVAELIEADD